MFEQALPRPPQLEALLASVTSHPSVCLLLLQSAVPALHEPLQTPAEQVGVAMPVLEHTVPHALQLDALVLRLVSQPSNCLLLLQSP